jgi:hypothetical protein
VSPLAGAGAPAIAVSFFLIVIIAGIMHPAPQNVDVVDIKKKRGRGYTILL